VTNARPQGREEVVEALVASARKLVAERGPSVALREIAQDAGVTFGLLHHYLGTKDELVGVVYRAAAESMAERLADAEHLDEAIDHLMHAGDGTTARLIAWSVLEGRGASPAFGNSPSLARLAELLRADADGDIDDDDARLFAAFVMTIAMGWRLFAPTALLAAGVDDPDPARHTDRVARYVADLART
jgi:AcrR family transcriptional regulator